jgi:hypothetical protein
LTGFLLFDFLPRFSSTLFFFTNRYHFTPLIRQYINSISKRYSVLHLLSIGRFNDRYVTKANPDN